MKVITINCGSATLKFAVIELEAKSSPVQERQLASGIIDRIGYQGSITFAAGDGDKIQEEVAVIDHGEAVERVLSLLTSPGRPDYQPDAVGHRVVHGGDRFDQPAIVNAGVVKAIEELTYLAPLHNRPSLAAIRAVWERLGTSVPQVVTFDTLFYHALPERSARYAIPAELAARHKVRRYGFHGLAHRYMMERYAAITGQTAEKIRLITLQLGNGCSASAISGGQPVDTSMGLTPLEGLMMGTRSGDVDPSLAVFLARREGVPPEKIEDWLNTRSGLSGVSGISADMRDLLDGERRGNDRAALAVDMFCYRAKKYTGSYLAALGGANAIVFGGGIGENSPEVRARILGGMEWCGIKLDEKRNTGARGVEARITADTAAIHAYVIPVNEAVIIARDTARCLQGGLL